MPARREPDTYPDFPWWSMLDVEVGNWLKQLHEDFVTAYTRTREEFTSLERLKSQ